MPCVQSTEKKTIVVSKKQNICEGNWGIILQLVIRGNLRERVISTVSPKWGGRRLGLGLAKRRSHRAG